MLLVLSWDRANVRLSGNHATASTVRISPHLPKACAEGDEVKPTATSGVFSVTYNPGGAIPGCCSHPGWYLECHDSLDEFGEPELWTFNVGDMWFARQSDAERAAMAFYAAGYHTDAQMISLCDDELRRIAYGALAW